MEYVSGNIFVREMRLGNIGTIVDGHSHNFDHTTYVVKGSVLVEKLDDDNNTLVSIVKRASDGFNWILIKAGTKHRITALEPDCIAHCIYSHRSPQGEVQVDYDGWGPGYV